MSITAARDLLGVTSAVLDHSDELWAETKSLVKHAEARTATANLAELKDSLQPQSFAHAAAVLQANAPVTQALEAALADAQAAASSMQGLHESRDTVVSARVDALTAKDAEIAASRESLKAEMTSRKEKLDSEFAATLRPLAAAASS